MNTNLNRLALGLTAALFAGTTLAGGGHYPANDVQESTRTRADVRAELKSAPPLIRGDVYPVLEATTSQRTREEVRAEAARVRPVEPTA